MVWLPFNKNSNRVCKFSGLGLVTYTLEYPNATAAAIDSPSAADFPRPRDAVKETVADKLFSEMASINFKTALP